MSGRDDLRRRLFAELDRGEDADLREIFDELGLNPEPSAFVDAQILAAVPGAEADDAPPPAHVDRAILAAADHLAGEGTAAPVTPLRPRWPARRTAFIAVAMAAGLLLAFQVGRFSSRPVVVSGPTTADDEATAVVLRLMAELFGSAPGIRHWGGQEIANPDDPSPLQRASAPLATTSGGEGDRVAERLVALSEQLAGRARLAPELEAILAGARSRCPDHSRCRGLLSLRLGEMALEAGRGDAASAYAEDAAATSDPEIRERARLLAEFAGTRKR